MTEDQRQVNFRIGSGVLRELRLLAVERDVRVSDLVRTAVEQFVQRERAKQQEQEAVHLAKGRGH